MPEGHNRLIERVCRVNPHTVVVLHNGAPVEMPWVHLPEAVLETNEIINSVVTGWRYFSNPRAFTEYGRQKGRERIPDSGDEAGFLKLTEEEARQLELPKEWLE